MSIRNIVGPIPDPNELYGRADLDQARRRRNGGRVPRLVSHCPPRTQGCAGAPPFHRGRQHRHRRHPAPARRVGQTQRLQAHLRGEPLSSPVALELAGDLAESLGVSWNELLAAELLRLLGTNVPYFIHLFFSELGQLAPDTRRRLSPEDLHRVYRERLLGPTCKHYFQHYSTRLKRHGKDGEAAAKAILRAVANAPAGRVSRSSLFGVYQKARGRGAGDIEFEELLGDLEHDWYLVLD